MKIIKLYAWEVPFTAKITATRDRELGALWNYQLLQVSARGGGRWGVCQWKGALAK